MQRALEGLFHKYKPLFDKGGKLEKFWPLQEGLETFFLTPGHKTHQGAHVRDPMDMKRLMIMVVYALMPALLFGMWNVGYQGYSAEGVDAGLVDCVLRGAYHVIPIVAVSYAAGGVAELLFCIVRKHEVNEGLLVTAMIFPLTLPPSMPLWMVALSIVFGVVIGKEVFGGTGMNVLNPALTARAFAFFTYPVAISGAKVWDVAGKGGLFGALFNADKVVDGYTGATPLLAVSSAERGTTAVQALAEAGWTWKDLFLGTIPGSIGETSTLAVLIGVALLLVLRLAAWEIMVGCIAGLAGIALVFNVTAGPDSLALMTLPPHYHLVMGGFAYGAAFMATDPVSAAVTTAGRFIYGAGIGVLCGLVRVVNPAYPEGMMLSILFMNVFAPLIDYYVVRLTTRRRAARLAAAA